MPCPSAVGGATSPSGPPTSSWGSGPSPPRPPCSGPGPAQGSGLGLLQFPPRSDGSSSPMTQSACRSTTRLCRLGLSTKVGWGQGSASLPPRVGLGAPTRERSGASGQPRLTPPPLAEPQLLHPGPGFGPPSPLPSPPEEGVSCGLGSGPLGKASPGSRPPSGPRSFTPPLPRPPQVLGRRVPAPGSPSVSPRPGQETFNTTGVTVTRAGSEVSAAFDGAVAVSVRALSNILHASCGLPAEYRQRTEGLLGEKQGRPCLGGGGTETSQLPCEPLAS